jgi:hypothetical protein
MSQPIDPKLQSKLEKLDIKIENAKKYVEQLVLKRQTILTEPPQPKPQLPKFTCECGAVVPAHRKALHLKSRNHCIWLDEHSG